MHCQDGRHAHRRHIDAMCPSGEERASSPRSGTLYWVILTQYMPAGTCPAYCWCMAGGAVSPGYAVHGMADDAMPSIPAKDYAGNCSSPMNAGLARPTCVPSSRLLAIVCFPTTVWVWWLTETTRVVGTQLVICKCLTFAK